jgi:hypothetical protein
VQREGRPATSVSRYREHQFADLGLQNPSTPSSSIAILSNINKPAPGCCRRHWGTRSAVQCGADIGGVSRAPPITRASGRPPSISLTRTTHRRDRAVNGPLVVNSPQIRRIVCPTNSGGQTNFYNQTGTRSSTRRSHLGSTRPNGNAHPLHHRPDNPINRTGPTEGRPRQGRKAFTSEKLDYRARIGWRASLESQTEGTVVSRLSFGPRPQLGNCM